MFGSPFINQQYNIDKINQQIQELEKLRSNYQNLQQPTNIINVGNSQNFGFEARYLNENEKPDEIFVQRKTAFISLKNGKLYIKEMNGDIVSYDLIIPKTKEQLKIEELERRLGEYEHRTNNEIYESTTNDIESNESTAKNVSRTISKKS